MNHSPSPAPRRGRLALNLAASLLGLLLVAQLIAIGWALHRKQAGSAAGLPVPAAAEAESGIGTSASDAPGTTALPATSGASAGVVSPAPGPAPAPEAAATEAFPITDERVRFFLGSALASRDQGDMKAALTQLRAACDLQPEHPRLLYELATTYDAMSLTAKASPVWDQLAALGESGGIYFRLAQARFEQGDGLPPREIETPLRLGKILERAHQDPAGGEAVTLRIPVQALEGAAIDPGHVSVVTQFYDDVDGEILETDAVTDNWRWLSGQYPTWRTNSVEFLEQPYSRPSGLARHAETERRYHGYVVKLYYNDHLQDMVAKPTQLANRRAEPGERGLRQPVELYERRPGRGRQIDDSLFPPLPQ